MVKEKRILSYFIGWLIIGFTIMFVGINKIFAATYYMNSQYSQQYYDNRGSAVSSITTTWNESLQSYISGNITTVANSYGAGLAITSPIPILSNHTYTLSIYFEDINNIALSSKNNIAIGNSISGVSINYSDSNFWAETIQSKVNNNTILQFVFKANGPASFIFIPWTTTSNTTQSYVLTEINMEDLGSEGISQQDINNSLNNQTNTLNNSIQNSTDTITGEIDDMEQSIIDSNKETQEVIKDQFNDCRPSKNKFDTSKVTISNYNTSNKILDTNKIEITSTSAWARINIKATGLDPSSYYTLSANFYNPEGAYVGLYETDNNRDIANRQNYYSKITLVTNSSGELYFTLWSNWSSNILENSTTVAEIQLEKGTIATSFEKPGEICSNKIDETNDKLDGIQGALTDSSAPNTSGLENSAGWLPAGPLDSILNLPLTMLNSLTNSLGKTCSPLNLTLPYVNKQIQIPCLSAIFAQITGVNGLWTWVGTIASVLILYNYLLNLYAWVDRVLTLRAEFDEAMGADLANWGRL